MNTVTQNGQLKITDAQQAKKMDKFMNDKHKQQLLKTNTAIWFNTICKAIGLQYGGPY